MIYRARKQQLDYGRPIGIMALEEHIPCPPGVPGNPTTFDFPVCYEIVRGVSAAELVHDPNPDPEPFIAILDKIGLPTDVKEIKPGSKFSFDGTVRELAKELAESTATVTVSAANPIIAIDKKFQEAALKKLCAQTKKKPAKKPKAAKVVKKAKAKKATPKKVAAKKKPAKAVKMKTKKVAPKKVVAKKSAKKVVKAKVKKVMSKKAKKAGKKK